MRGGRRGRGGRGRGSGRRGGGGRGRSAANQNPMSVFVKKHLPMDIPKSTKIRLRLSLDT